MLDLLKITYENLIKTHKEFLKDDKVYEETILQVKDTWKDLDLIIDFVRRWNSRVPIEKNKEKIKEAISSLKEDFEIFKNNNIEDFEFNINNIGIIKRIYEKLSETALKFTGTSKLMHGINPNLFVMWDIGIRKKYGVYQNYTGYINFMKLIQEIVLRILKEHSKEEITKDTNRTLPKLIDEYNWINFRTSKYKNETS